MHVRSGSLISGRDRNHVADVISAVLRAGGEGEVPAQPEPEDEPRALSGLGLWDGARYTLWRLPGYPAGPGLCRPILYTTDARASAAAWLTLCWV